MKSALLIFSVLLFTLITHADEVQVSLESWCHQNRVIALEPMSGIVYMKYDCEAQGLTCGQKQVPRGGHLIVIASCHQAE